ncbi:unnamed protein product [Ectocarpus sp. CCAP 1310/34]|nr:unnamed protein product [Ectocarpus sp. CCAP 1310/34]
MPRSCVALGVAMTAAASVGSVSAFTAPLSSQLSHRHHQQESSLRMMSSEGGNAAAAPQGDGPVSRRQCLASAMSAAGLVAGAAAAGAREAPKPPPRARLPEGDTQGSDYMELGGGSKSFAKPRIRYPDFRDLENGLQFKDAKVGTGRAVTDGDRVVFDWEGYTIGYNGNLFESNRGPKGGDFDKDKDSSRFVVGSGTIIPGLEEGIKGMQAGGVRQIVVPPELGYPEGDRKHDRVGPKPSTFSGTRALDFVLSNPGYIDKTLLFTVKVVRVDKPGDRTSRSGK